MSTIRIACLGDIMCGDSFYNAGSGVASSLERYGKKFLREEIVEYLCGHDLVVGNVECVLSDKGRNSRLLRSIHMRGAGRAADYLADWNLTVANVANNHILEHGYEAAMDTVDHLRESGIRVVGSGPDRSFREGLHVERVFCRGLTLAFIGMCLRREKYAFNGGAELEEVVEAVRTVSASGDLVCVCVHWGDEYMDYPSREQTATANALIGAGARIVVGHHPHVVQGLALRDGTLIAYSLGNFIFDSCIDDCCWSVILTVEVADGDPVGWHCLPIVKDHEHRPVLAHGQRKAALMNELERRCNLLKTTAYAEGYQQRYQADFKSRDARARGRLRRHVCKRIPRMKAIYWPQVLLRPIQRRLRIW